MSNATYPKRHGTSGIRGQLNETKLISLIHFRAKHNILVNEYLLATNMDEVGAFDDICLRLKLKGFDRPVAVFLQAKHRENENSVLTLNSRNDLAQYFHSFLNIRRAFKPGIKGFFEGNFDDTECVFVMYTTAKHDGDANNRLYKSPISSHLNDLISTGKDGRQPRYKHQDVEFLCNIVLKEQLAMLAELMGKILCKDDNGGMPQNSDLILRFSVILRLYAVDVSDIELRNEMNEHRIASFRTDFFENNNKMVKFFKDALAKEVIKKSRLENDEQRSVLDEFFKNTSDVTVLSQLIGSVVLYDEGKFKFANNKHEDLKEKLMKVNVSQSTVDEAIAKAAKEILKSKPFKVPVIFGNNDLTISKGKVHIIEGVLDDLKKKIVDLLRKSDDKIVKIDESLEDKYLQLNQGLASAVGNLLVRDDTRRCIKFTEKDESLGNLAKRLMAKIKLDVKNLQEYSFNINVERFPKLYLGEEGEDKEIIKHEVCALAQTVAKFVCGEIDYKALMNDELIFRYHVVLVDMALEVSEVRRIHEDDEHRIARFRPDFFETKEELPKLFKDTLSLEILRKRNLGQEEIISLLTSFFNDPSDVTILSRLVENVVNYEDGKLQYVCEVNDDLKLQLNSIDVSISIIDEAIQKAAKEILTSIDIKVSASFGNKDLTIKPEKGLKIENTLNTLNNSFTDVLSNSKVMKIVTIDESLGDELLKLGGGLAGAVGNLLTLDEQTNLLKFTDNVESLEELSKALYLGLQTEVLKNNYLMNQYRFDVKVNSFPKLTFGGKEDEDDFNIMKGIFTQLAATIAKFLCQDTDGVMPMDNRHILLYHVILVHKAIDVSEIRQRNGKKEYRIASFRKDFFDTDEECLKIFKETLFKEVLKRRTLEEDERRKFINTFLHDPFNIISLSKVIWSVLEYNRFGNGKLNLVYGNEDLQQQLNSVNVSQSAVDQATALAAIEILTSKQFKVPAAFGNKDFTIDGESDAQTEALKHLTAKITEVLNSSTVINVVTIHESLKEGGGFLKPSGGIAGLVGNLLVHDGETKLLKFTDNYESLEELSRRLFDKLKSKNKNLHQYRFDVKVKNFPILTFDSSDHERKLAKEFLNKLVFYTSQANETGVGDILKGDIEDYISRSVNNFRVTSDALFLKYHDQIQEWWMNKKGTFLTKECKKYEKAIKNIVDKPLMTVISLMYQPKLRNNVECTFNNKTINSLNLSAGTVVVTETIDLTVAKITQYLKETEKIEKKENKEREGHVVLDLEYMLNLQANEYNTLCDELKETNKKKLVILCKEKPNNRNWSNRLKHIAKAMSDKYTVMVTNTSLVEFVMEQFEHVNLVMHDQRSNFTDLTEDIQNYILENAKTVFQGKEVFLKLIVEGESLKYIAGEMLDKVLNNETIIISKFVGSINYEKTKHLYIERYVRHPSDPHPISLTLQNEDQTKDKVTLITAEPGMGKSTLLTHLSHQAKEVDPTVWIVRINLLDHSEEFSSWQDNKTDIDTLESLTFLCRAMLSEKQMTSEDESLSIVLRQSNGFVSLEHCTGDESVIFELKVFLHFYNSKNIIFLFDGFDEICPHYMEEVLTLLNRVKEFPKEHKMWIASRSYDEVKTILEEEFGTSYEIQKLSRVEQNKYLSSYWQSKILLTEFSEKQFDILCEFMTFMADHYTNDPFKRTARQTHQIQYFKACLSLIQYLRAEINKCPPQVVKMFNELFSECRHTIMYMQDFESPLHLYLIGDYLANQLTGPDFIKWDLNISAFSIYERFFETKLKIIRFEEKNKIGLFNSDNIIIFERARDEFFTKHRLLGAYAVFHQDADKIFTINEMRDIVKYTDEIKTAREKTGIVCGVSNDVPIFLHMTFAEYFAVQHICQYMERYRYIDRRTKSIWDFILNVVFLKCSKNVRNIFSYKIKENLTLRNVITENRSVIADLLLKQGKGVFTYNPDDVSDLVYLKIKEELDLAMSNDLDRFVDMLYDLKIKLTEEYLKDPTRCPSGIKRLKFYNMLHKKKKTLAQSD